MSHIHDPRAERSPLDVAGNSISTRRAKPLLLCLSHLRWDFVFQRPQHLLTRAAKNFRVLVVEEPVFETDVAPRFEVSDREGGIQVAVPHLPAGCSPTEIMRLQRDLIDQLVLVHGNPAVLWYYSPMAMSFSAHLEAPVCLYDCMDELSAFRGAAPDLTLWERRLFAKADFVVAGGRTLFEAKRRQHDAVTCLPSSIDTAHFARSRHEPAEPADLQGIAHPRLGFFGVIDERFDIDLLREAAAARPDWQFVMIGPVVKIDPASLPQAANIHWLGGKAYAELPSYLGNWDLGIMPFALNESTRFISPTKTPEFLAAGLKVVSTAITDVVHPYGDEGLVAISADAADFVAKCEAELAAPREGWLRKVDAKLATNSWDKSWARVQDLIQGTMAGKVDKLAAERALARASVRAPTQAPRSSGLPAQVPLAAGGELRPRPRALSAPGKE
jgi:glycosyltransferase involved in cell wall biosynthesis